ncbi:MAG: ribonuclease P protein component [Spirochaetales bacterium]|nr:ribonuclease P protein component [Spirochaetales bacterium]
MADGGRTARAFAFPKSERIRKRADIDIVFKKGTRFSVRGLRLHVVPNGTKGNRVVFVPVRQYGNSVRRNRARRLVREAYRLCRGEAMGSDLVFVIYPGFDEYGQRAAQVGRLLSIAGLANGNGA